MYHPSNGMPRTANTWGYIAVHEKQKANRAATASHGELPRLPSREGRKSRNSKRRQNSKGEQTLGYLGVVNPVTPEEGVPLRGYVTREWLRIETQTVEFYLKHRKRNVLSVALQGFLSCEMPFRMQRVNFVFTDLCAFVIKSRSKYALSKRWLFLT
ncbi:hypothetical protein AVEN_14161-1 [Araneus ventricosus]|uniref:Uncharacterized protein n=1 Tax=Araneus ventricosus TaxID=182803 RepID=A0A4Y2A7P0_ARAVE|nr:hypothetical protein AVEN_14161-1 [Araneus ventricosus]